MELLCPNCQKKLTVPDQYAGQLMRCPMCNGTFTTPSLSPMPAAEAPLPAEAQAIPSPAQDSYAMAPAEPAPPPPWQPEPPRPSASEAPPPPPPPPLPPGEYTRLWSLALSRRVLPWIAPAGLGLVFVLSFFPWGRVPFSNVSLNGWSLGFGEHPEPIIGIYLLFTLLALAVAVPSCLFALNLAPTPPAVQKLGPWRPAIVAAAAFLAFVFLFYTYLDAILSTGTTPGTIWLKLAFRGHIVAVAGAILEFWLEVRQAKNLPPPRLEVRW